jgi:histidine ammonia-lyase
VRKLAQAATAATALVLHALLGHEHHLHPALFEAKPHPGTAAVASKLRQLLVSTGQADESSAPSALQDPYSVRCAPHVLGVLVDASRWAERWIEIEANGASDNPLFDPESGQVLMGGNFYGGHIAFAMDSVKAAVASVADLCDRQAALLVDPRFNRGLPPQLVRCDAVGHHGFKGAQITMSALTAEALQTIYVCELTEKVVAIDLLIGSQACEIRGGAEVRPEVERLLRLVREYSEPVTEDRCLDEDISRLADAVAGGAFGDSPLS